MKTIIHGLAAGALASLASVIYFNLYQGTLLTAFDKIINVGAIIASSVIGCLLMALAYFFADKIKKVKLKGILNILFLKNRPLKNRMPLVCMERQTAPPCI